MFFLLLLLPVSLTGHSGTVEVRDQDGFDRLQSMIDSVRSLPSDSVSVVFRPGTYYFHEKHLRWEELDDPSFRLSIHGHGAVFIGAGDTLSNGQYSGSFNVLDGWFSEGTIPVSMAGPVRPCRFFPVPTRRDLRHFRIPVLEPDLSESDAKDVYVIVTQWYQGVRYKVDRIRKGYLYYHATGMQPTPWYSELRFGRCLPRYQLLNHPSGDFAIIRDSIRIRKSGEKFYRPSSSVFLSVRNSRIGRLTVDGCRFFGNHGKDTLIKLSGVSADSIRLSSCHFKGIKGVCIAVSRTPGFVCRDNVFAQGDLSALVSDPFSRGTVITGNFFKDFGKAFTNAPVVLCQGPDLYIADNRFEDFTYSAIGLGTHYLWDCGPVTSGVVERNEICHTPSFGRKPMRSLIDGGAVYVWTQNKDLVIRHNYIHDIFGYHGSRGIFCDDGVINVTVCDNLVLNIESSYPIDLRKYFKVSRIRGSFVRRGNVRNKVFGNIVDAKCRLFIRKEDPESILKDNVRLKKGYDRSEVFARWNQQR